jgi:hypothetical protein
VAKKKKKDEPEVVGFLGLGLDNDDGHERTTRAEHFLLLGGSAETHERMQDTVIRFDEQLKDTGKPLSEVETEKILDMLRKAMEK